MRNKLLTFLTLRGKRRSPTLPPNFLAIYEAVRPYTMVPQYRSFALHNAVQYLARNNIPGDFVECGVWRGGQAMLMAYTLLRERDTERTLYLYDTYAGMTEPTDFDTSSHEAQHARVRWRAESNADGSNAWCYASLRDVKENMARTGYPHGNIRFVEGGGGRDDSRHNAGKNCAFAP